MYRNLPFNGSSFSRSRAPWPAPGPEGGGCSARRRRRPRWMRIAESHPAEGPLRFHPLLNCTCIIYPNLVILQHFWGLWNWGIRARSLLVNAREKQKKFYENIQSTNHIELQGYDSRPPWPHQEKLMIRHVIFHCGLYVNALCVWEGGWTRAPISSIPIDDGWTEITASGLLACPVFVAGTPSLDCCGVTSATENNPLEEFPQQFLHAEVFSFILLLKSLHPFSWQRQKQYVLKKFSWRGQKVRNIQIEIVTIITIRVGRSHFIWRLENVPTIVSCLWSPIVAISSLP